MNIIDIDIEKLRNHPLNAKVFGELKCDADADLFTESIREHGVQNPITIGPENEDGTYVILAGHRRRQAAARCGHSQIPCIIREDACTPDEIDLVWSEMNLQREMTVEQRARYYKAREAIETQLAKRRQQATQVHNRTVPENLRDRENKGEAKDKAAKAANMSRPTAEKAAAVVDKIDALTEAGQVDAADDLRETLNTQSVAKAHRKATTPPAPVTPADIVNDSLDRPVPARLRDAYTNGQRILSIGRKLDGILRELKEVSEEQGGEVLQEQMSRIEGVLKTLKHDLTDTTYWTACPKCDGDVCKRCENRGWLAVDQKGTLSADEKSQLGAA